MDGYGVPQAGGRKLACEKTGRIQDTPRLRPCGWFIGRMRAAASGQFPSCRPFPRCSGGSTGSLPDRACDLPGQSSPVTESPRARSKWDQADVRWGQSKCATGAAAGRELSARPSSDTPLYGFLGETRPFWKSLKSTGLCEPALRGRKARPRVLEEAFGRADHSPGL
jgi:hypothetical protein